MGKGSSGGKTGATKTAKAIGGGGGGEEEAKIIQSQAKEQEQIATQSNKEQEIKEYGNS